MYWYYDRANSNGYYVTDYGLLLHLSDWDWHVLGARAPCAPRPPALAEAISKMCADLAAALAEKSNPAARAVDRAVRTLLPMPVADEVAPQVTASLWDNLVGCATVRVHLGSYGALGRLESLTDLRAPERATAPRTLREALRSVHDCLRAPPRA